MKRPGLIVILVVVVVAALSSAQGQTFIPLHQFDGSNDSAAFSEGGILKGKGGLFGTTTLTGTVFRIDSTGKESVVGLFNGGVGGIFPTGTLIQDAKGNLYGVAEGGAGGAGVVYKLSLRGKETALYSFQGGLDNDNPKGPAGGLFMDASGVIFGAAQFGSDQSCEIGCGSIFQLDQAGNLVLLHKFTGGADGSNPIGPLVQDAAGNLYGVAQSGGNPTCPERFEQFRRNGCGVVFKLAKSGELTVLRAFKGKSDGAIPQAGLLLDAEGNLYGTTLKGGIDDQGTVFKISKDGIYTTLHRFVESEGINPNGGLAADPAGNLFGTAQLGGDVNNGTAFQLRPDGTLKVLHSFEGLEDGDYPQAGLFRDSQGRLYGTTVSSGLIQLVQGGCVFEIIP